MSYQVLARKWRPQTFKEVIGQPHVLTALENGLTQDRLHHAYLFSGTRGVGKTTIARILAKSLNCETGVTATPCGVCANCQAIDQGRFVDLLEIDAASRTKVDDTRELLDNVQYKPAQGRYKVYLIDEVHMLSKHSFNALLKTLEEPPEYVKFLLATTDPQKLPITVLSRCLQFHLKAIMPEQIEQQLAAILHHEKATFDAPALRVIAKAADGSMRDALSLTDQALAFGSGHIEYAAVLKMLGTIDQSHLHYLLHFIASGNSPKVFEKIQEFVHLGADFSALHQELASLCHQIALMQLHINPNVSKKSTVQLLAERLTPEEVQLFYQIAVQGFKDYAYAPNGKIALEMTVMRLLAFKPANYIDIDESMIGQINQAALDVPFVEPDIVEPSAAIKPVELSARAIQSSAAKISIDPVKVAPVELAATQSLSPQTISTQPESVVSTDTSKDTPTEVPLESSASSSELVPEQVKTSYTERSQEPPASITKPAEIQQEYDVQASYTDPVTEPEYSPIEAFSAEPEAPISAQPAQAGSSFNLAATTNSRNMLRSHRLKREELKKNEAATEQSTVKANDRFAAPETKSSAPVSVQPLQHETVERQVIVQPVSPKTVETVVKPELTPERKPNGETEQKPVNVAVKNTSDEQSDDAQSSDEQGQYDQYLPPLSSYEEQASQPEYGEYDYSEHDYFTGHDVEANDVNVNHADTVDTNVTNADTHAIENSSAEEQSVESHHDARNDARNSNEIHQDENVTHEKSRRESAAHQRKETTDNNHIKSQVANNDQKKEQITSAVSVQPETAPERKANITPVKVPQTINSPVIMATSEVNFDISGLNVDNSTEVALSTDGNFPIAEIDMAAYVDDKMTDPWFLAIKEMQLAGFEKLLAKSCVMQKQGQQIDLILDKSQRHLLNNQDLCEGLKALLKNYYGEQYSISIEEGEAKEGHTPMQLEKIVYQQYLTNAKTSIQHDVMVQTFVSDYAAKVYENSVVPL